MNIAEMIIYSILLVDSKVKGHITPDGKKFYFLFGRKLVCLHANHDVNYNKMTGEEINVIYQNYIRNRMNSN